MTTLAVLNKQLQNDLTKSNKDLIQANTDLDQAKKEISRLRLLLPSSAKHTRKHNRQFWAQCSKHLEIGNVEYFKHLIEDGKISMTDTNEDGQTLLLLASCNGCYEVVQLCLNLGADINHTDDEGEDAMHHALEGAWYHIEQLLLIEKMHGNFGSEVQDTAKLILKQRGFIENIMNALKIHRNKKIVMDTMVSVMIKVLEEKKCFSDDMLQLCWAFVSENDNNPLKSKLWETLKNTCKDVIGNENTLWWYWMKKFVMPSTIWFEDTSKYEIPEDDNEIAVCNCPKNHGLKKFVAPNSEYACDKCEKNIPNGSTLYGCRKCDYDLCSSCYFSPKNESNDMDMEDEKEIDNDSDSSGSDEEAPAGKNDGKMGNKCTYLFYKLLALVKQKSCEQLEDLQVPMNSLREQNPEAWEAIVAYDIKSKLKTNCRQDKIPHGLTANYDPIELAKATTSSANFDSAAHYDYNEYLSEMVLTAYMVDDQFQKSVQVMYDIDTRTNSAVDKNGDTIKYIRGPVKLMERCKVKAENDYANEPFPTSACVLDLNRCSLVFSNLRSLLTALTTFENKVKHYEGHAIIDIVRDKNGFFEYSKSPCYADIKLNVLVRGMHNNIIAEVQFLLQQMKDFKAKAHNLYNITRKEEFIANTSKLLPMLLDTNKSLFVHGNAGNTKGLCELMVVSNKSPNYIMKVDEESKESILINVCCLGRAKTIRFLQTIIPSDLFVDRLFYPNRYNSLSLEGAIENKQLLTVKVVLSSPEIQAQFHKNDDQLFRLIYETIQSYDEKVWNFVTSALNIDNEKLLALSAHKINEPPDNMFADGAYTYHDKTFVGGSCLGDNIDSSKKMIELFGEESFCDQVFEISIYDTNHLEKCIQSLNFEKSKFLLSLAPIAMKFAGDSNVFFRYLCWLMRCANDEYWEWFRNEYNLNDNACRKYFFYKDYPTPDLSTYLAGNKKLNDGAFKYHDKGIVHWAMRSNNISRCKWIFSLIEKHDWYSYLTAEDVGGWTPFELVINTKQFEFGEYLLDNIESDHRKNLIDICSWIEDEKTKLQLKEWKVKYL